MESSNVANMEQWLIDILAPRHTCARPPRTDEVPSSDLSEYNITPAMDEEFSMYAQNVILQDNGEETLTDDIAKLMTEKFRTYDGDMEAWNIYCNIEVADYYMYKAGRWEEYVKWQKKHHMNGF